MGEPIQGAMDSRGIPRFRDFTRNDGVMFGPD